MQTIDNEIKSGNLSRFHLIYGEESYMIRYYKKRLKDLLCTSEDTMNVSQFEGDSISIPEVVDLGNTLPFFAEHRVLILTDTNWFKKSTDFAKALEAFPESTYVIFSEKNIDKRNSLYKWLNKNGCVTECKLQQERELVPWAARYLKQYNKKISQQDMAYFISKIGFSMDMLSNELDKLISYVGNRDEIFTEDIDAICSGQVISKIFDMIDATINGNRELVFRLYADLLELKEPPLAILRLIARHLNILLQLKDFANQMSDRDLGAKIHVPYYFVKNYRNQAKHFSKRQLIDLLEDIADTDERFKTGNIAENVMIDLFLSKTLTNHKKNGTNI